MRPLARRNKNAKTKCKYLVFHVRPPRLERGTLSLEG